MSANKDLLRFHLRFANLDGQANALRTSAFSQHPPSSDKYEKDYIGTALERQIKEQREKMTSDTYPNECNALTNNEKFDNSLAWFEVNVASCHIEVEALFQDTVSSNLPKRSSVFCPKWHWILINPFCSIQPTELFHVHWWHFFTQDMTAYLTLLVGIRTDLTKELNEELDEIVSDAEQELIIYIAVLAVIVVICLLVAIWLVYNWNKKIMTWTKLTKK